MSERFFSASSAAAPVGTNGVEDGLTLDAVQLTPAQKMLPPFKTLAELMENAGVRYADREALGVKKDGEYSFLTYAEVKAKVDTFRSSLAALGVQHGDCVAIISRNTIEWVLTAYGGYGLGAINVPMYEQQKPADWEYILNDSCAKVIVVNTKAIYDKIKALRDEGRLPFLQHVLCVDLPPQHPESFGKAMRLGEHCQLENKTRGFSVAKPEDLATLIYTSGTTGQPKGVMLTHSNLCSNVKQVFNHQNDESGAIISPDDRSLAFLPWAHSYGQLCELHAGIAIGASAGIAAGAPGDAAELMANIHEVRPTVIFSVPTLFKKLFDGVTKKVAEEPSPLKRFLMQRALAVGASVQECRARGMVPGPLLALQHRFLDKAVLAKMRDPLGGRLRIAVVAGAPTPVPVIDFIESLGLQMTEGYGLTETSPVVAITNPDPRDRVMGTVGRAIPGTAVRIVDPETLQDKALGEEGELWVSGPQVMKGYWNKPDATAEVMVKQAGVGVDGTPGDHWFRTGDLVTMVGPDARHIRVTGRSKEQYKLENGKYVAPSPIEDAMSLSKFVQQAVLYGSGRPHNVAAVVPDYAAVAEELGLGDWYDPHELCDDPRVHALMEQEIPKELNARGIKKYEQPKAWCLIAEPFSADNEMLTPKLSIRKANVVKAYKHRLDALYEDAHAA